MLLLLLLLLPLLLLVLLLRFCLLFFVYSFKFCCSNLFLARSHLCNMYFVVVVVVVVVDQLLYHPVSFRFVSFLKRQYESTKK